jgi:hypothetical protein
VQHAARLNKTGVLTGGIEFYLQTRIVGYKSHNGFRGSDRLSLSDKYCRNGTGYWRRQSKVLLSGQFVLLLADPLQLPVQLGFPAFSLNDEMVKVIFSSLHCRV